MNGQQDITTVAIEKVILDNFDQLPKNQKKIADYILKSMSDAAFQSVVEIGEICDVSKATVVRFAQSLGFEGFFEFRNSLQAAVHNKFTYMERLPLIAESERDILYRVARQDVKNINQTIEYIQLEDFDHMINAIDRSDTIYTFGLGISALMAQILSYSLHQVAVKSRSLVGEPLTFEEQVMYLTKKDAIIIFSFPPYSRRSIEVARLAFAQEIPVIAITDKLTAPINDFASHKLLIQSENMLFTNSFAAISVLINAITTEISVRNKKKTLSFIKKVNENMTSAGHFEL